MDRDCKHTHPLSLRAKDAAAALGLSERKFREIQHRLPHVDLDGVRVFPVDALRAWLAANAHTRQSEIDRAVDDALRDTRRPTSVKVVRHGGLPVKAARGGEGSESE